MSTWSQSSRHGPRPRFRRVRAAVLRGEGKVSAGADLTWMSKMVTYSHEENVRDARAVSAMFIALDALPVPLVGRVHGAALGGWALARVGVRHRGRRRQRRFRIHRSEAGNTSCGDISVRACRRLAGPRA